MLRAIGKLVRSAARSQDLAARYGGEEICLILPDTTRAAAAAVAESIRLALAARPVPVSVVARRSRTSSPSGTPATSPTPCAASAATSRGPSCSSSHTRTSPTWSSARAATCRFVVGLGDGENFLGSDVTAFIAHTREALAVDQDQVVEVRRSGVRLTDLRGVEAAPAAVLEQRYHVDWDTDAAEKGGYECFMLKEIDEQPEAVRETVGGRLGEAGHLFLDELSMSDEDVLGIEQVVIIGCGSAYHSGSSASSRSSGGCRLPVQVEIASEFRYQDPVLGRRTLVIAVSQSGETADTLEAVRHARRQRPGCSRSPTRWARRSPARPTPCSTPAVARRSRLPRPRPSPPR